MNTDSHGSEEKIGKRRSIAESEPPKRLSHAVFSASSVFIRVHPWFLCCIVLAESQQPVHLDLSKRWARGTAILFAVGAVSGTVLSFELGLLPSLIFLFRIFKVRQAVDEGISHEIR